MDDTCEKLPDNTLRAEQLLGNKGISTCVLKEWERSLIILPKKGKKHFEPNNSWLQNTQIEKSLKTRRDLLNIERIDRVSELASAEWIPAQRKALVTKRSGQDWGNFGLEKNGSLYLIPEEALFLLETNCIELIWNGVPCSIQQAYEILIDESLCTLEEYRVYSQLTRYGYRLRRYFYEDKTEKCSRSDEAAPIKRKVIVDPENGLRMCDNQAQNQQNDILKRLLMKDASETLDKSSISFNRKNCQNTIEKPVKQVIHDIVDELLNSIESQQSVNSATSSGIVENNTKQKSDANGEKKNRNSKVEIISDETLLGNIKILSDTTCNLRNEVSTTSKWPGTRIQRNVKLLPKRNDKVSSADVSIIGSGCASERSKCGEKRKISGQIIESSDVKKSKHEVIELSDDEIQELPRPMTRMEMLNLLPNIAKHADITQKISKRYIPYNIKPQKRIYQYNYTKIQHMHENDRRARQNCKSVEIEARQNAFQSNAPRSRSPGVVDSRNAAFHNQLVRASPYNMLRPFYPVDPMHGNIGFPYAYNRFSLGYGQAAYALQNRITLMQQNVFQNMIVAFENHENAVQQSRRITIQMNNFAMPFMGGYRMRPSFLENQCRHAFYQNFMLQQRSCQRRAMENALTVHGNALHPAVRRRYDDANRGGQNNHEVVNRPSFTTRSGVNSWAELKKKWCEEKTITIDDEDYKNRNERDECNEVQVVEQFINPLVGPRNASSLAEVFNKLAIIKSASEKTVRRKKNRYKISYSVYSCANHYKKTNPGQPLYSLVVIRKDDSFLQPVELNRLQQDAKGSQIIIACVSMAISYIQPGIITMPNVT